jgi:hypothetical protein
VAKSFQLDGAHQIIKEIIHDGDNHLIIIRSLKDKNGLESKNTLVKIDIVSNKNGKRMGKHRGLNLDDLLVVKKNWNKILGSMTK